MSCNKLLYITNIGQHLDFSANINNFYYKPKSSVIVPFLSISTLTYRPMYLSLGCSMGCSDLFKAKFYNT